MSRSRLLGLTFSIVMVLLLGWNAWALVRNQHSRKLGDDDKLLVRPRSIAMVAKQNAMSLINTTLASYQAMREKLAGKHLLISPDFVGHRYFLERLARISVTVAPKRIELPREVVQRIFDQETNHLWAFWPSTFCGAVLDRSTTRYVVVWRPGDKGVQVVIPEARYRRELAAIARAGR